MKYKSIIDQLIINKFINENNELSILNIKNTTKNDIESNLLEVSNYYDNLPFYDDISNIFNKIINETSTEVSLFRTDLVVIKKYILIQALNSFNYLNNEEAMLNSSDIKNIVNSNFTTLLENYQGSNIYAFIELIFNSIIMIVKTEDELILNDSGISRERFKLDLTLAQKNQVIDYFISNYTKDLSKLEEEKFLNDISFIDSSVVLPISPNDAILLIDPIWQAKKEGKILAFELNSNVIENHFHLPVKKYVKSKTINTEFKMLISDNTYNELQQNNILLQIIDNYKDPLDLFVYKIGFLKNQETLFLNILAMTQVKENLIYTNKLYLEDLISLYNELHNTNLHNENSYLAFKKSSAFNPKKN